MTDASVRTVDRAEVLTGDWPDDVSILISPGVGGRRRHGGVFAGTARSVYDELVARGVTVAYATNRKAPDSVLIFKSAEWWGPVLTIGETVGSGVVAAAIY